MAKDATATGVEVITWGSGISNGNGMLQFIDTTLFGGNTGHAAIKLTIPADEEGRRLIDTYCNGPPEIPYQLKNNPIPNTDEPGKSESVYEVYFSWWPERQNEEGDTINFNNHEHDRQSEAKGVNVKYDEKKWDDADAVQSAQRKISGRLGERVITVGLDRVVHLNNVTDEEMKHVALNERREKLSNKLDENGLFLSKIEDMLEKSTNDRVPMTTTLNILINRYAKEWKENLKPEDVSFRKDGSTIASLSKEALEELRTEIQSKFYDIEGKINKINYEIDEEIIERLQVEGKMTINLGANPDNIVRLPIASSDNPNDSKRLNPEKMLQQMRKIADTGGFDIMSNNCSGTVDSVLAAGCNDKKLQQAFKGGAYGVFKNPQEAYLHAKECQHEMLRSKPKGRFEKIKEAISKNNPLKLARNQLIKTMASPNSGSTKITLAAVGLVGLAVVSTPIFLAKKITNPTQTIKDVDRFSHYAATRPSPFMKVMAAMASGPAHLLLGGPAMIQNGVKELMSEQKVKESKKKEKSLKATEDKMEMDVLRNLSDDKQDKVIDDKMTGYFYHEMMQSKINESSQIISEKNPKVAIDKFCRAFEKDPNSIPTFDKKTESKVADYLNKTKDAALVEQFGQIRLAVVERLKAIESKVISGEVELTEAGKQRIKNKSEALFEALNGVEDKPKLDKNERLFSGSRLDKPPPLPPKGASNNGLPPLPAKTTADSGLPPLPAKAASNDGLPPLPAKTAADSGLPPLPAKAASNNGLPPLPSKTFDGRARLTTASTDVPPLPARQTSFMPGYQSMSSRREETKKNDTDVTKDVVPVNPRTSTKM